MFGEGKILKVKETFREKKKNFGDQNFGQTIFLK